jgi:hypothetical protein
MSTPCSTCAFGTSGAANEPKNSLTGIICALGGKPFFCHHGKDGTEYDWQQNPLGPFQLAPENRKVCAGWQAKVQSLNERGFFANPDYRVIRRAVAERAFSLLRKLADGTTRRGQTPFLEADLKRCVAFLKSRDIGDKEIPL